MSGFVDRNYTDENFTSASLLMPWGGEIVAPSLEINFLNGLLDPKITFTRASSGSRINSSGLVVSATTNTPRFDYDPITLEPLGLLIEDSKSNVCQQSETFDNATWTKTSSTITANDTTAPDGNVTADKIVEAAATASHLVTQARSVTTGNTYCFSVWLKAAERGFAFVTLSGAGFSSVEAGISVNLTTGAVSTAVGTPVNSGTQTFPNGWFRVWFTYAATASASSNLNIYTSTDGVWANVSYAGDNTKGIYAWGAQLETQQFPSSYIATTNATVTRAVDVADITTLTPWFNTAAGTLFTQTYRKWPSVSTGTCGLASFNDNTANNRIYALFQSSTSIRSQVTSGGATQVQIDLTANSTGLNKQVLAWQANNSNAAVNGTLGTLDTASSIPTVDRLSIGAARSAVSCFNGHIQLVKCYATRLGDGTIRGIAQ